jgi:hypothetical protein
VRRRRVRWPLPLDGALVRFVSLSVCYATFCLLLSPAVWVAIVCCRGCMFVAWLYVAYPRLWILGRRLHGSHCIAVASLIWGRICFGCRLRWRPVLIGGEFRVRIRRCACKGLLRCRSYTFLLLIRHHIQQTRAHVGERGGQRGCEDERRRREEQWCYLGAGMETEVSWAGERRGEATAACSEVEYGSWDVEGSRRGEMGHRGRVRGWWIKSEKSRKGDGSRYIKRFRDGEILYLLIQFFSYVHGWSCIDQIWWRSISPPASGFLFMVTDAALTRHDAVAVVVRVRGGAWPLPASLFRSWWLLPPPLGKPLQRAPFWTWWCMSPKCTSSVCKNVWW